MQDINRISINYANEPQISTSKDVFNLLLDTQHLEDEYFIGLFLNQKNRVMFKRVIAIGTLGECVVHPRSLFRPAAQHNCARIIVSHNHPSGDPTPSKEDIALTSRLIDAGKIIGIPILDHIIVGRENYESLRDRGDVVFE